MKLALITTAAIIAATSLNAADAAYVDARGCTHTPILGADGSANYWNLGLEAGCGRVNKGGLDLGWTERKKIGEQK